MPRLPHLARLSDHLVLHLAREIVSGRLKLGDSLPAESDLTIDFGVSKVVVRESLQLLASFGLVRVQQGKRTVVLGENEWSILAPVVQSAFRLEDRGDELTRQLYEVRVILETHAAAWMAKRTSDAELERLGYLEQQMREISRASRDTATFMRVDRAFHDLVAESSGNIVLRAIIKNVHEYLAANWRHSTVSAEQLRLLTRQHERIAEAIRVRDPEAAIRGMEAHLQWAQRVDSERIEAEAEAAVNSG